MKATTGKTVQRNSQQPVQDNSQSTNTLAKQVYRLALFDHLPRKQTPKNIDSIEFDPQIHPLTIKLGALYSKGFIQCDDDRITALISVFMTVVKDYKTPPKKVLREDLDRSISKQVQHLVECRQLSKGMGNFIKFFRQSISKIPPEMSESDSKSWLLSKISSFLEEKIYYAGENIAEFVNSIVNENDVILTYGSSPLLRKILMKLSKTKNIRLIVVDSRPLNEGIHTLTALSSEIHCVYTPIAGAPTLMKGADKVLLGASCLLSNGSMLGPAGSALIAGMAKVYQIPVIVASESYKFSDKVQLDSIVFNELGSTKEIAVMASGDGDETGSVGMKIPTAQQESGYRGSAEASSAQNEVTNNDTNVGNKLNVCSDPAFVKIPSHMGSQVGSIDSTSSDLPFEIINLRYDLTPISNISVVATETGLIPPTSVPVLMRELQMNELNNQSARVASELFNINQNITSTSRKEEH